MRYEVLFDRRKRVHVQELKRKEKGRRRHKSFEEERDFSSKWTFCKSPPSNDFVFPKIPLTYSLNLTRQVKSTEETSVEWVWCMDGVSRHSVHTTFVQGTRWWQDLEGWFGQVVGVVITSGTQVDDTNYESIEKKGEGGQDSILEQSHVVVEKCVKAR